MSKRDIAKEIKQTLVGRRAEKWVADSQILGERQMRRETAYCHQYLVAVVVFKDECLYMQEVLRSTNFRLFHLLILTERRQTGQER